MNEQTHTILSGAATDPPVMMLGGPARSNATQGPRGRHWRLRGWHVPDLVIPDLVGSRARDGCGSRLGGGLAVQSLLQLRFAFLAQRGLQHGATELGERLGGLVRGDLLHHEEQAGGAGLEQIADLVLELLADTGLGDLAHERAHPGPDRQPEERDEEQQTEQHAPEHAPYRSGADRVMLGVDVDLAFHVAVDGRDRVRLDDEIPGQAARLGGGGLRRGLVRVPDDDQIRHAPVSLTADGRGLARRSCWARIRLPAACRWISHVTDRLVAAAVRCSGAPHTPGYPRSAGFA